MKQKLQLNIIHEDDDLIIIDKPAGLLSIPDRFRKEAPNLYIMLKNKFEDIFVVHRLDLDTSGVMVFCKNAEAHRNLNMQFDSHDVKRIYHVVVAGIVQEDEMSIDIPLLDHPTIKGKMIPSARGKESLTVLRVLERYRIASLVQCELITGRHHQIRTHCAAIGHQLIVDGMYGQNENFMLSTIKRRYNIRKNEIEKPIISRVSMHSKQLEFLHPSSNELVKFTSEYPKDFAALTQVLQKYSAIGSYMKTEDGFGKYFKE